MAHNARQLGEVADWAHRNLNFRKRSGARRQFGFHSYRYFAKMLVKRSAGLFAYLPIMRYPSRTEEMPNTSMQHR